MQSESLAALPPECLRRWAKASKEGKRALQAFGAGHENARGKLEEAVEALNAVCDDLVEWRDRNGGSGCCAAGALVEAYCNEAAARHQMSVALESGPHVRVYLATWKLEPFVNGMRAEEARLELKLMREVQDLRDRVH